MTISLQIINMGVAKELDLNRAIIKHWMKVP
jgi:hypothetical protein